MTNEHLKKKSVTTIFYNKVHEFPQCRDLKTAIRRMQSKGTENLTNCKLQTYLRS